MSDSDQCDFHRQGFCRIQITDFNQKSDIKPNRISGRRSDQKLFIWVILKFVLTKISLTWILSRKIRAFQKRHYPIGILIRALQHIRNSNYTNRTRIYQLHLWVGYEKSGAKNGLIQIIQKSEAYEINVIRIIQLSRIFRWDPRYSHHPAQTLANKAV